MKKITALALAVVMMLMTFAAALPVVAAENEAAANLQAAMNKGENVTLTGDVDLSDFAWTTISEYAGTLDGAGYTITVPADTPFIDKLSGTVKNVTFVGNMTLDGADVSTYTPPSDFKGGGIGVVANYAWGATVDNVKTDVDVYVSSDKLVNFGGIVGNAWSAFDMTEEKIDDGEGGTMAWVTVTIEKNTKISNCSVYGHAFVSTSSKARNAVGGIIGMSAFNTSVEDCAVHMSIEVNNCNGQCGGIIGSAYGDNYAKAGVTTPSSSNSNREEVFRPTTVSNCLFDGVFTNYTQTVDQSAALVGYARGLTLTNSFADGSWNAYKGGGAAHIYSYANVTESVMFSVTIDGCATNAIVHSGNGVKTVFANGKTTGFTVKNCFIPEGYTYTINGVNYDSYEHVENKVEYKATINNNTYYANDAAVAAAFVEANSEKFELVGGKVYLKRENVTQTLVLVKTAEDLRFMTPGTDYYLENDLDLTGTGIGNLCLAEGHFYGQGYTITLDGKPLFASVAESVVDDLVLEGNINKTFDHEVVYGALAVNAFRSEICDVVNNVDVAITLTAAKGGDTGTVIGVFAGSMKISNLINNGALTFAATDPAIKCGVDAGGLIGEWSLINVKDANYLKYSLNNGDISYFASSNVGAGGTGNVGGLAGRIAGNGTGTHDDDVSVYQCANKGDITGKISGERAGGLFGYHRDESIDLCYNTGKMLLISDNTNYPYNRRFAFTGYTNTGNKTASQSSSITNSYAVTYDTVESCFGNGNAGGSVVSGNFIPEGVTDTKNGNWGETGKYDASTTYTDADDLFTKLQANEATVNIFAPDYCNINRGYPVFFWESHVGEHEYETLYTEGGKNYVSTGKDLACDTYSKDRFSGFVQFSESDPSLARFIFAINEEELTNEEIESFDLTVTVSDFSGEEKSYTVNSEDLIAYTQVVAAGETFYGDNAQMFGFVVDFGDYEPLYIETTIEIEEEVWYYGSYRF